MHRLISVFVVHKGHKQVFSWRGTYVPQVIDELVTYDEPAKGAYRQLWRVSESEYEYKFFSSSGYGIDANSTFRVSVVVYIFRDVT